jgi:hypothetical protein
MERAIDIGLTEWPYLRGGNERGDENKAAGLQPIDSIYTFT